MSTSFSVKKLLSKLGYVSSIAAVASGLTLCTLHDAVLEHKEVYNKGLRLASCQSPSLRPKLVLLGGSAQTPKSGTNKLWKHIAKERDEP